MLKEEYISHLNGFNASNFAVEDKQEICEKANWIISKAIGISPQKVVLLQTAEDVKKYMSENARGSYDPTINTIYLNVHKYSNPYIILATIGHETMHIFVSILMQRNFGAEKLDKLTYEQYVFATAKCEDMKMYKNFIEFAKFCNLSTKYLNMLRLDKIYYGKAKNQPYYYNTDSSEVLAEYLSYILLNKVRTNMLMSEDDKKLFCEAIEFLDYSYNGNVPLKRIYVEENATNKSPKLLIEKWKLNGTYNCNMFDINEYDIDGYEEIWSRMEKEYKILEEVI